MTLIDDAKNWWRLYSVRVPVLSGTAYGVATWLAPEAVKAALRWAVDHLPTSVIAVASYVVVQVLSRLIKQWGVLNKTPPAE